MAFLGVIIHVFRLFIFHIIVILHLLEKQGFAEHFLVRHLEIVVSITLSSSSPFFSFLSTLGKPLPLLCTFLDTVKHLIGDDRFWPLICIILLQIFKFVGF